eukprot:9477270-Pyramimonas_sp.AAC.1
MASSQFACTLPVLPTSGQRSGQRNSLLAVASKDPMLRVEYRARGKITTESSVRRCGVPLLRGKSQDLPQTRELAQNVLAALDTSSAHQL